MKGYRKCACGAAIYTHGRTRSNVVYACPHYDVPCAMSQCERCINIGVKR